MLRGAHGGESREGSIIGKKKSRQTGRADDRLQRKQNPPDYDTRNDLENQLPEELALCFSHDPGLRRLMSPRISHLTGTSTDRNHFMLTRTIAGLEAEGNPLPSTAISNLSDRSCGQL
jgi:hypothetical protein